MKILTLFIGEAKNKRDLIIYLMGYYEFWTKDFKIILRKNFSDRFDVREGARKFDKGQVRYSLKSICFDPGFPINSNCLHKI